MRNTSRFKGQSLGSQITIDKGGYRDNIVIEDQFFQTWFKNRRAKWRREHRNTGLVRSAGTCFSSGLYVQSFSHVPYPNSKLMIRDARMLYETITAHASDNGQMNRSAFNQEFGTTLVPSLCFFSVNLKFFHPTQKQGN